MTKEITKAFILQQLEDKLGLRELEPEKFCFSEEVVPIYNIEPHLGHWTLKKATVSVTGTGLVFFFKVPANERWTLRAYQTIFMTGAFTTAGVYIDTRFGGSSADFMYLDLAAAQNVSYLVNLPVPVVLESGARIFHNIDGYTTTGDLMLTADLLVEEIR